MKKLLIIAAALLLTSGSLFAQKGSMYLGLGLTGFSTGYDNTFFGIAPEFGYFLTDDIAIGGNLLYNYNNDKGVVDVKTNTFGIGGYARYYAMRWNALSLYLQGGLSYQFAKVVDVDGSNDIFDINIRPGIQYDLSDNISILANFGELGYQNTDGDSRFRLRLNAATIGFGMVFRF